jgi:hypothetical protein
MMKTAIAATLLGGLLTLGCATADVEGDDWDYAAAGALGAPPSIRPPSASPPPTGPGRSWTSLSRGARTASRPALA